MPRAAALPLALIALLAACRDEPSVAEKFNAITADVESKGRNYETEAENVVADEERRLANEGEAAFQQMQNGLGNAADVDVNSGAVEINMR
jgi:hypothetical protein